MFFIHNKQIIAFWFVSTVEQLWEGVARMGVGNKKLWEDISLVTSDQMSTGQSSEWDRVLALNLLPTVNTASHTACREVHTFVDMPPVGNANLESQASESVTSSKSFQMPFVSICSEKIYVRILYCTIPSHFSKNECHRAIVWQRLKLHYWA